MHCPKHSSIKQQHPKLCRGYGFHYQRISRKGQQTSQQVLMNDQTIYCFTPIRNSAKSSASRVVATIFLGIPFLCGQPPHHSEAKVWERSWEIRGRVLNAVNGAQRQSPPKFYISKLSFSLKFLKIWQIQASKVAFMQISQLTPHNVF